MNSKKQKYKSKTDMIRGKIDDMDIFKYLWHLFVHSFNKYQVPATYQALF